MQHLLTLSEGEHPTPLGSEHRVPASTALPVPGGRVGEGGGRSVSPTNLYLTDRAFCPPPHLVCGPQHQAQRRRLVTVGVTWELSWHHTKLLIYFQQLLWAPGHLRGHAPCPQPPGHQRLGQVCCPLICICYLAPRMRRINLGLPHSYMVPSLAPTRLSL